MRVEILKTLRGRVARHVLEIGLFRAGHVPTCAAYVLDAGRGKILEVFTFLTAHVVSLSFSGSQFSCPGLRDSCPGRTLSRAVKPSDGLFASRASRNNVNHNTTSHSTESKSIPRKHKMAASSHTNHTHQPTERVSQPASQRTSERASQSARAVRQYQNTTARLLVCFPPHLDFTRERIAAFSVRASAERGVPIFTFAEFSSSRERRKSDGGQIRGIPNSGYCEAASEDWGRRILVPGESTGIIRY